MPSGLPGIWFGKQQPDKIIFPSDEKEVDFSYIKGKRVIAFSGIARPESFKETLKTLGADIVSFKAFGDHYPFTHKDILKLRNEQKTLNAELLITTEKDWARIGDMAADIKSLAYLTINFVITSGKDKLFCMIKTKADNVLG